MLLISLIRISLHWNNLVNIHLLDRRSTLLDIHLVVLLWLLLGRLLSAGRCAVGDLGLGLGSVHDGGASVNDVLLSLVDLGRGDDGVDVLGLLGLSSELVLEPLLGSCALLNL